MLLIVYCTTKFQCPQVKSAQSFSLFSWMQRNCLARKEMNYMYILSMYVQSIHSLTAGLRAFTVIIKSAWTPTATSTDPHLGCCHVCEKINRLLDVDTCHYISLECKLHIRSLSCETNVSIIKTSITHSPPGWGTVWGRTPEVKEKCSTQWRNANDETEILHSTQIYLECTQHALPLPTWSHKRCSTGGRQGQERNNKHS